MRRRDFLSAAAGMAGLLMTRRLNAAPWGQAPDARAEELLLPPGLRAEKVLEVFLYGGLGPFESFYVVEEYGRPEDPDFPDQQWYLFQDQHDKVFEKCGLTGYPLLQPFALDSLGKQVNLGPLVLPLRTRPDILKRMRVLVHRHALEPHEAAIPYSLSGQRLGSPRMAGSGSAVQRYFMDRDTTGRRVPYSYVLYTDKEIPTDNLRAASSVGLHPGAARPLDLRISAATDFQAMLSRANLGGQRAQYDALTAYYVAQAQQRYTYQGAEVRSRGLGDHVFATQTLKNAPELQALFPEEVTRVIGGDQCGQRSPEDTTAMGLTMATHLLTHPDTPARYVTVVDGGMIPAAGGGGYDVHSRHLPDMTRNITSCLESLISHINEPGEDDPTKIDLDTTMVVLTTEFGRTPFEQAHSLKGTNHHPYGYVNVLIGGPVGPDQAGVLGAIGPDGWADHYLTPKELRAAILAAMGIYPFSQESFAIGDLRDLHYEKDGLLWLNEIVLGRKS